ncbi:MAG TPA: GNAT family N-acetyltransferase [Nitrososphaeraceae archaeon]|nr:GNAT family N-acetyltransferase [Nitrososphaeraceae archaeon]
MTTTEFRVATVHDKDYVLDFCKNTFSWGDYIDRVWDIWIREPDSILLVAVVKENNIEKPIAISHGILIPEKIGWIEGIRVDPKYRYQKLATNMSLHILDYARKNGALYSSAIVSINNEPSKGLMKKLGFKVISKWSYLSIKPIALLPELNNFTIDNSTTTKVANLNEYQQILNFLNQSDIFKASGKKFVNSWRWYDLTEDRLKRMINNGQVIILVKNDDNYHEKEKKIRGIALIDKDGYWNSQNIFQIVYIDARSDELLLLLVIKCLEFITLKEENKNKEKKYVGNKYERVQIFSPFPIKDNSLIFQKFNINFSEQFLLYHKEI